MSDRVRKDGARWGERRIRPGGRVRWLGRDFVLEDGPIPRDEYERADRDAQRQGPRPRYDGTMDGMLGLFYTYGSHHEASKDHVYLHSIVGAPWPGPECVAGYFVWDTFALRLGGAE